MNHPRPLVVTALLAAATASVPAQTVLQTFPALPGDVTWYPVGDLDGDGIRDVGIRRASAVIDFYSCRTGALHLQIAPIAPNLAVLFFTSVGDVNGDGRDDISYLASPTNNFIIASGLDGRIIHSYYNPMGFILEELGDLNNDGKAEFLRGDPGATIGGVLHAGRGDVIDGRTGLPIRSYFGSVQNQYLGSMRAIGDADRDGIADYILYEGFGIRGYSGLSGQQLFFLPAVSQSFGEYLTPIGDFNADGFDDFALFDRGSYPYVTYERTSVFGGPSATLLWSHTNWVQNPGPYLYYSAPTGNVGDLDGDGFHDLGVGGWDWSNGTSLGLILSGRNQTTLLQTNRYTLQSPGDANDDGAPDHLGLRWQPPGNTWMIQLLSGMPPGTTSIGQPCPDANGIPPTIGIGIGARLGETMTVNLSRANPNLMLAVLGMGFSDQAWNNTPLPIDLGAYGLPGCQWHIAADHGLWMPTAGMNGTRHQAQHPIPVPGNPTLLGATLYFQWLVVESASPGLTGAVTRAMRTTVVQ